MNNWLIIVLDSVILFFSLFFLTRFMKKRNLSKVTPFELGIKLSSNMEPQIVILDGNILNEGFTNSEFNKEWIKSELKNKGISLEDVFIGEVDSSGNLYLDLFDDTIQVPKVQIKEMLYASLQKSQADLMSFALETENEESKYMYIKNAKNLENVMKKLEPYLLS